jgi:hypothetical protein
MLPTMAVSFQNFRHQRFGPAGCGGAAWHRRQLTRRQQRPFSSLSRCEKLDWPQERREIIGKF